ncbi:hypothetical protein [Amycolatopsis vancoresmycina]|uniref:Uncharacterized protein n=1 Tax=Amycolatopsis vancoresmycina DSM 44592 TaxID=1292037 RepID=R1HJG5_9PSEU|nr:hypothetical protein [Amycolatopsis vancoresmycina]EOD63715.1 hypothetical protein H480_35538 [Amycolatopsis vancoresmycina DSM 44592]
MTALDQARAVGDAVLYEGYLLYPYRASAPKNRVRWQWGVLVPPSYASAEIGEHASARVECLVEPLENTVLHVKLRFLQTRTQLTWDEAVEHELDFELPLAELPIERTFAVPGDGERTHELSGVLTARLDALDGPFGGARLRAELHNTTSWPSDGVREHALRHALLAAHLVLSVDTGHFLSMLDPPEWAKPAVEACRQDRLWPVLIGDTSRSAVVLASPIILYDDPAIAPESPGDLFDGTEIDEILTLRTMTLTDEEKREARATDPRAAAIVDRVDAMPPELLERLHGAVRSVRPVRAVQPLQQFGRRRSWTASTRCRPNCWSGCTARSGPSGRSGPRWSSGASASPKGPGCCCGRTCAGPTPRTCSSPARRPPCGSCCPMWTVWPTWR